MNVKMSKKYLKWFELRIFYIWETEVLAVMQVLILSVLFSFIHQFFVTIKTAADHFKSNSGMKNFLLAGEEKAITSLEMS